MTRDHYLQDAYSKGVDFMVKDSNDLYQPCGPYAAQVFPRNACRPVQYPMYRKAFTLTEILTVIAIITVLMAILLPVIAKAREKGNDTADISNLRQIGIARQLYTADYSEIEDIPTLVRTGYLSKQVLFSRDDEFPNGFATEFLVERLRYVDQSYPLSYHQFSVLSNLPDWEPMMNSKNATNVGWVVNIVKFSYEGPGVTHSYIGPASSKAIHTGPYQRLMLDGSVRTLRVPPEGTRQYCDSRVSIGLIERLYADFTAAAIKHAGEVCSSKGLWE